MSKICDMLLNLEGFQYAMSLDLNMGYYYMRLSKQSSNLFTIILPWGKYRYKRIPMGLVTPHTFPGENKQNVPMI